MSEATDQPRDPRIGAGSYAQAGVDVDLHNNLIRNAGEMIKSTHGPRVLGKAGGFGGLFAAAFPEMEEPVLVASIDSVGTKVKVAQLAGRFDTVGQDIVNHCVNDIAVLGAKPLFFLDYIGIGKLEEKTFNGLLAGLTQACREAGASLIGGETAEMPGVYAGGDFDLVGSITGIVDRARIIDGSRIREGDVILGLPSNGLHTNGYSLARKVFFETLGLGTNDPLPGAQHTVAEELLRVHQNYQPILEPLIQKDLVKGLAHITGGGLIDHIPRILPENVDARIDTAAWEIPPVFQIIAQNSDSSPQDMFHTFNMGIGMAVIVSPIAAQLAADESGALRIGEIVKGDGQTILDGI